jgi:FkbM family methyltransferase
VGPTGRVFAYEPGVEARQLLQQSRNINAASNLEIFALALSDREREGRLRIGASSELNALDDGEAGEPIRITSLDIESGKRGWPSPDFVKIDAEGEEERILAGGREFFARNSPLVMFEIKAGQRINEQLRDAFPAMGYRLFRLLAGAPILVPVDRQAPIDPYELNLFGCKPDRMRVLRNEGFLVDEIPAWEPDGDAIANGLLALRQQAFAPMFGRLLDDARHIDPDYAKALAAFAAWRTSDAPAHIRCAALYFAYRTLAALCNRAPTTARFATFARLASEGGWRGESLTALSQMAAHIQRTPFQPMEPCWSPNPRFDNVAVTGDPALWFATAVLEQLERARSYSTCYSGLSSWLPWLCDQPVASLEMHRRKTLIAARGGANPVVPPCLQNDAADHLNAALWRSGAVPGTRVAP